MVSELVLDELTGRMQAGSIAVTVEGGTVTTKLQQGLIKSWVNMNGSGTIANRDSFNTSSSPTDNGTGDYTTTYTNNLSGAEDKCIYVNVWNTTDDGSNASAGATRGGSRADQAGDTVKATSSLNVMSYYGAIATADEGNVGCDVTYCITPGDCA